jgi:hypothetical protein
VVHTEKSLVRIHRWIGRVRPSFEEGRLAREELASRRWEGRLACEYRHLADGDGSLTGGGGRVAVVSCGPAFGATRLSDVEAPLPSEEVANRVSKFDERLWPMPRWMVHARSARVAVRASSKEGLIAGGAGPGGRW